MEAQNACASTPLAFRFAAPLLISSTAGDIEGDVRSTLLWENTRIGTYSGGIAPMGGLSCVAMAPPRLAIAVSWVPAWDDEGR